MEDPVTTDSGQTYERSAIQENIQRNGKTDPFTRKPISGNLYPNFALKKAIQDFIDKYNWINTAILGHINLLKNKTIIKSSFDDHLLDEITQNINLIFLTERTR